jgi:integrase
MKNPHSKLVPIDRNPGLFRNPLSQKIYYRGTIKGVPLKFSTGVINLAEAKKIVDDKKAEIYHGKSPNHARKRKGMINPKLSLLWEDFYQEKLPKWAKATQLKYRVAWNHGLKEFWGDVYLSAIKTKRLSSDKAVEFENWYLRNKPGRSFFDTRKSLLAFLGYLEEKDLIERAPKVQYLDQVINAAIKRKKVGRVYDDDEIKAALEASAEDIRTHLAILFGRYMGLRKLEIVSAEKTQIDLSKAVFKIWAPKTGSWRMVPIPKIVMAPLKQYMATLSDDSAFLFPMKSDPKRHTVPQLIDKGWAEAKLKAKIKDDGPMDARFHDLRHTFATQTVDDEWNPIVACSVLGMSLKIYQKVYAHVSDKQRTKAMNRSFEPNPIDA